MVGDGHAATGDRRADRRAAAATSRRRITMRGRLGPPAEWPRLAVALRGVPHDVARRLRGLSRGCWSRPWPPACLAVVTEGSDTGGLIQQGVSGFVCGRDPAALADAIRAARHLDRDEDRRRRRRTQRAPGRAGGLLPALAEATVDLPTEAR